MRIRIFAVLCFLIILCTGTTVCTAFYADEVIEVTDVGQMQSLHPYESNTDIAWVYTHPENATYLEVTFSEETYTEDRYDAIYIYDGYDNRIGEFSGDDLAGKTLMVGGSRVAIRLISDSGVNKYGFAVTSITGAVETGPVTKLGFSNVENDSLILTFPPIYGATSIEAQVSTDGKTWQSAQLECDIYEGETNAWVTSLKADTEYYFRLSVKGGDREGFSNVVSTRTRGDYVVENGCITDYDGYETELDIPSVVSGEKITAIGDSAFKYSEIISVTIPEGVISLGDDAFSSCENLEKVTLPESLTEIGESAFSGCGALGEIRIPDGAVSLGDGVFSNCDNLERVTLPENLTEIGESVFLYCDSLETITLPGTLTKIDSDAFSNCTKLKEIIIPDSVVSVGEGAFEGCTSLKKITLGINLGQIGEDAFSSCPAIEEINWNCKKADNSYKKIFKGSGSEENGVSVKLGDSVEELPHHIFQNLEGNEIGAYIDELDLGNSIKKVGWNAFQNAVRLKELTIPASLESIWEYAFNGLASLENLYINSNVKNPGSYSYGIFKGSGSASPSGLTVHFGDTVTEIGAYIFKNCEDVRQIVISDSVKTVGEGAFSGCTRLESVSGGAGIETIGKVSFRSCSALGEMSGMKSVKTICEQAFSNCVSLKTFPFSSSVTSIETKAFEGCTAIKKLTLGKNPTAIGNSAFSGCTGIETIHISGELPDFKSDNNIFYLCGTQSKGIKVVFAENVSHVPAYLFAGNRSGDFCPNIISVHIGSNVKSIGKNAFYWNRKLKELTGGSTLETIGESAFSYCDALVSVEFFPMLKTLEAGAFSNCNALSEFTFSETVRTIGGYAFGYTALKEIIIPEGVEVIGSWAFEWCKSAEVISVPSTASFVSGGFTAFSACNSLKKLYWNTNNSGKVDFNGQNGVETEGFELIIGDSVETVPSNVFSGSDVRKVILGANTVRVGERAFSGCDKLKEVILSPSVKYIDREAFSGCGIEKINLDNVFVIGENAFMDCPGITDIKLSSAIKIDAYAFYKFAGQSLYAPEARYIGNGAFYGALSLKSANLPKAEYIGYDAFRDCSSLETVTLSRSLAALGNYAFYNCALKQAMVYSEKARNTAAFYGNSEGFILNYYSERYNDIVLNDKIDNYPGLIGQTVRPEKITITGPQRAVPGEVFALSKDYEPKSANDTTTSWTSSKPEVATVVNGIVTCLGVGNTIICATAPNGAEAFHFLTVTEADLEILCDSSPLVAELEKTITVYASFESEAYAPDLARWETDDDGVAVVETTGYTEVSHGKYTLYAVIRAKSVGITDIRVIVNEIYSEASLQVGINPDRKCTFIAVDNKRNPIEGATIKIGDYEIATDHNGEASFVKSLFSGKVFVDVEISCDGYAERTTEVAVYENAPTYIILEKIKDDPFFTDILIRVGKDGDTHSRNLMDPNTSLVYVSGWKYSTPSTITAIAYWGDNQQGQIKLVSERTGDSFELENNAITFNPSASFRVGDTFRLEATALAPDGTITKTVHKLPIRIIEYNDNIFPPINGTLDLSHLPGFDGVVFEPNIGIFSAELEFDDKDGVFSLKVPVIKKEIPIFKDAELEITLSGDLKYPLLNPINPSFTGGISLSAEVEEIYDKPLGNAVVMVGYVPVPITGGLKIGAGIDSSVEVTGLMNDPHYHGEISPNVTLDVSGGIGSDFDEVGMSSRLFLETKPDFTFEFNDSWKPVFNPSLEINFGCRAEGKIFSSEASYSYNIFNLTYEDGKWAGDLFDSNVNIEADGTFGEFELHSAQLSEWSMLDRSYISDDTGFCANEAIGLFDIETTNRNETLIYNDIISSSEALLGYVNGKKTLIYTCDDTQRDIQNGLKLVYTVENEDGTWSEPQSVWDDLTADSAPAIDKNFVIWENVNSVLGEDTDITEYLGKTEIAVSRFNEDLSTDTWCLTENAIYDSAPDIAVFDGGAMAVWVTNDANDITRRTGTNTVMYSLFEGNGWSQPRSVCTAGQIGTVRAEACGASKYIFYTDGKVLKAYCVNTGTEEVVCDDVVRFATATDKTTAVSYFDSSNNLMFTDDFENIKPSAIDAVVSSVNHASAPQIVSGDGETYIVWSSRKNGHDTLEGVRKENGAWTDVITFASGEKDVLNPSLVVNDDNTFGMAYYSRLIDVNSSGSSSVRDCALYVCDITPSYNLAISNKVEYDEDKFRQNGTVEFAMEITNIGELNADGFEVIVSEGGEPVASFTENTVLKAGAKRRFSASFAHVGAKDISSEYEIRVVPLGVTDFDTSDNTASFSAGITDMAVRSAYFTTEFDKTYINIIVANEGTTQLTGALVRVNAQDASGREICILPVGEVGCGEVKMLRADVTGESTRQLYVSAFATGDANRYNDSAIAYRTEGLSDGTPSVQKEFITNSVPVNGDEIAITQLTSEDITSLGFDITNEKESLEAMVGIVYVSDGEICGFTMDSFTLANGTSRVLFESVKLSSETDSVKVLIWDKENLKPLIVPKEYELQKPEGNNFSEDESN